MPTRGGACVAAVIAALLGGCGGSTNSARSAEPSSTTGSPDGPIDLTLGPIPPESAPDQPTGERGWLGIELAAVAPGEPGVSVRSVVPGSPAAKAGLAAGDVILSVAGRNVVEPREVVRIVAEQGAGRRVSIGFSRGATQRLVAARLEPVPSDDEILRSSYVGAPAPAFDSLKTVQGSLEPKLSSLRGKVVIVEFWAPWCMVCRLLVPVMNDWHARYSAQGAVVVGIAAEPVEPAARAAYQLGMVYPIAVDDTGRTSRAYRAIAVPTLFVVDRRGTVRDVLVGYSGGRLREIDGLIARLLTED